MRNDAHLRDQDFGWRAIDNESSQSSGSAKNSKITASAR